MTTLIDRRRSYVAGRWVEGDVDLRGREPGRRVDGRRGRRRRRSPRSSGPSPRPAAASTRACGPTCPPPSGPARLHALPRPRRRRAKDDLVPTMIAEAGQPRGFAEGSQFDDGHGPGPLDRSTSTCRCPTRSPTRSRSTSSCAGRVALSVRRHEPVGVVTAITPYNARASSWRSRRSFPALMAGNSVILRPSPLTPISSLVVRRRRRRRRASRPAC